MLSTTPAGARRAADCGTLTIAAREGALLCSEGLALLEAFGGRVDAARATFRAAAEDQQPSGRLLREWALFEKRQGRLQVLRAARTAAPLLPCWAQQPEQGAALVGLYPVPCPWVTSFGDCLQDASDLFARAAAVDPQDERTWLAAALLERRRGNYLQVSAWNWRAIARPIAVSGLRARWYWRCQTSHMFAQCICHFSGRLHCMSHASNVQPSTSSQGGLRVCKRFCEVDMLQH